MLYEILRKCPRIFGWDFVDVRQACTTDALEIWLDRGYMRQVMKISGLEMITHRSLPELAGLIKTRIDTDPCFYLNPRGLQWIKEK